MELSHRSLELCNDGMYHLPKSTCLYMCLNACLVTLLTPNQLWDLFESRRLFNPHGNDKPYSEHLHLAQMVSNLGPPPLDYLKRSEKSKVFWDDDGVCTHLTCQNFTNTPIGTWKGDVPIPETSLLNEEARLEGEEKTLFLRFLRKMLQWKPEDRQSLRDIIADEWLLADLIEDGQVVRD